MVGHTVLGYPTQQIRHVDDCLLFAKKPICYEEVYINIMTATKYISNIPLPFIAIISYLSPAPLLAVIFRWELTQTWASFMTHFPDDNLLTHRDRYTLPR